MRSNEEKPTSESVSIGVEDPICLILQELIPSLARLNAPTILTTIEVVPGPIDMPVEPSSGVSSLYL